MNQDEFDKTQWHAAMTCSYGGQQRKIASVCFEERLIGLLGDPETGCDEDAIDWVRCENVILD